MDESTHCMSCGKDYQGSMEKDDALLEALNRIEQLKLIVKRRGDAITKLRGRVARLTGQTTSPANEDYHEKYVLLLSKYKQLIDHINNSDAYDHDGTLWDLIGDETDG